MSEYVGEYVVSLTAKIFTDLRSHRHEGIVRCRDCKYHELQTVSYSDKPLSVCTSEWCEGAEGDNLLVEPDGFCWLGERRERESAEVWNQWSADDVTCSEES